MSLWYIYRFTCYFAEWGLSSLWFYVYVIFITNFLFYFEIHIFMSSSTSCFFLFPPLPCTTCDSLSNQVLRVFIRSKRVTICFVDGLTLQLVMIVLSSSFRFCLCLNWTVWYADLTYCVRPPGFRVKSLNVFNFYLLYACCVWVLRFTQNEEN